MRRRTLSVYLEGARFPSFPTISPNSFTNAIIQPLTAAILPIWRCRRNADIPPICPVRAGFIEVF